MRTSLPLGFASIFLIVLGACAAVSKATGFPPHATRAWPPMGVEATAVAVGATVPAVTIALSDGQNAALVGQPTVLLLYRGQW